MQSLCYQLPAIVSEAICLVISPLISLAKDQVDNWNSRGSSIDALAYNCTVPAYVKQKVPSTWLCSACDGSCVPQEISSSVQICKDVACGEPMLLYATPEALVRDQSLRDALKVSTPLQETFLRGGSVLHRLCESY
jgi:superfamily II DNA helicase RecQ